ncbi:MAG: nucleotidyltransferase domain-containing protein [Streptosporangiaceae bacterium]
MNPLRSLAPTVDSDVLAVLARTHGQLTGAAVQRLAGRSYAQVRHALHRLAEQGIVDAQRHGQAVSYSLNREHVLAAVIEAAAAASSEAERRLRATLLDWSPQPAAVILFGSFARRDGGNDSDIDLLIVRDEGVAEDDQAWTVQRYDLATLLERWTGNPVQILELGAVELRGAITRDDALIAAVRDDGRVLAGPDLRELLSAATETELA